MDREFLLMFCFLEVTPSELDYFCVKMYNILIENYSNALSISQEILFKLDVSCSILSFRNWA